MAQDPSISAPPSEGSRVARPGRFHLRSVHGYLLSVKDVRANVASSFCTCLITDATAGASSDSVTRQRDRSKRVGGSHLSLIAPVIVASVNYVQFRSFLRETRLVRAGQVTEALA